MTSVHTADYPRTFPVADPVQLSVQVGAGSVTVTASDVTEAVVDLKPAHPGDRAALDLIAASRVALRGDSLVVHVPEHQGRFRARRTPSVLVSVELPTGSDVAAEVGSADVETTGTIGTLEVQTGSGDLTVTESGNTSVRTGSGDVRLGAVRAGSVTSGSGDIRVDHSAGDLLVQSGSGDVRVTEARGDCRITTASGDVELDRTGPTASVRTASGEVAVRRAAAGDMTVTTASGDVSVGIAEGIVTRLDCSSVSGEVHSQLEPSDAPGDAERRLLLHVRTVSGAIAVHRTSA